MTQAEHIAACHSRFMAAVRDGRRGEFEGAKAIVERVRGKAGDAAAEWAKTELWRYIRSEKTA